MTRQRRTFTPEFKRQLVKLYKMVNLVQTLQENMILHPQH